MTDASQGPDWWRASDGHVVPARVASCIRGSSSACTIGWCSVRRGRADGSRTHGGGHASAGRAAALRPTRGRGPAVALRHASPPGASSAWSRWPCRSSASSCPGRRPTQRLAGLFVRASVAGVDLGPGRLFCGVLAVVLRAQLVASGCEEPGDGDRPLRLLARSAGALSVYEIVDIIAVPTRGSRARRRRGAVPVRVRHPDGLPLQPDRPSPRSGPAPAPPARWRPGPVGGRPGCPGRRGRGVVPRYRAAASPVGPIPVLSPERPVTNGGGAPRDRWAAGRRVARDRRELGERRGSGTRGLGTPAPAGPPGAAETPGLGGGLGNSGLGNSGSGIFGNSGHGGLRTGPVRQLGHRQFRSERFGISSPGGSGVRLG